MKKLILLTLLTAAAGGVLAQYQYSATSLVARGNDSSTSPWISSNGSLIAFYTKATNLATGASVPSIQVYNPSAGTYEICSPGLAGGVSRPSISRDGLFVAFYGSTISTVSCQPYVYDLTAHTLTSISTTSTVFSPDDTMEPPTISDATGGTRYVAFRELQTIAGIKGGPPTYPQIRVWNKSAGTTLVASRTGAGISNGPCTFPVIDSTGSNLAFVSTGTNLVSGLSNQQVYYSSLSGGAWSVSSSPSNGMGTRADWPSITSNGAKVAFQSNTGSGVADDVYLWTTSAAAYQPYPSNAPPPGGLAKHTWCPSISPDGAYISLVSDRMLDTYTGVDYLDTYWDMYGNPYTIGLAAGSLYSYVIHVGANDIYSTGFTGSLLSFRVGTAKKGRAVGGYGSVSNNGDYAVFFSLADRIYDATYPSFNEIYMRH